MRPSTWLVASLLLLISSSANAQGLGLDLTDEPKQEPAKTEPPKSETPPPQAPTAAAAAPGAAAAPDADLKPGGDAKLTEVDIANEDRVKSVQRKEFLKLGRFELTPMAFMTINDAFYPKFGPGARISYFPNDSFGIALRGFAYIWTRTENVRLAKHELQSQIPYVQPKEALSLDLLWSPIYGKVALFQLDQDI